MRLRKFEGETPRRADARCFLEDGRAETKQASASDVSTSFLAAHVWLDAFSCIGKRFAGTRKIPRRRMSHTFLRDDS